MTEDGDACAARSRCFRHRFAKDLMVGDVVVPASTGLATYYFAPGFARPCTPRTLTLRPASPPSLPYALPRCAPRRHPPTPHYPGTRARASVAVTAAACCATGYTHNPTAMQDCTAALYLPTRQHATYQYPLRRP